MLRRMINPVMSSHDTPPPPLENSAFWTTEDQLDPKRFLRPTWDNWERNAKGWLHEAVQRTREQGHQFCELAKGDIGDVPQVYFENAFHTAWNTLRLKYAAKGQPSDRQEREKYRKKMNSRKYNVSRSLTGILVRSHLHLYRKLQLVVKFATRFQSSHLGSTTSSS
jgi:hypothetical protein